jgi:hypothetical protein
MQLHLLLESIEKNANNVYNINVLYKHSDEKFKEGYEILINSFPHINWVEEKDDKFKEQTLSLMETNFEFSCFMVDDNVFFGKINEAEITKTIKDYSNIICFSPRQGINTTSCYTMKCDNIILPDRESDNFIFWNWGNRYADAGYPLSLDGHIFRTKDLKKMVKSISFSNPNTLEEGLQIFDNYPRDTMFAYKRSIFVGIPINIVNNTHPNRNGEEFSFSAKDLNEKYLDNQIIDYDSISFSLVKGAHQELKFKFVSR